MAVAGSTSAFKTSLDEALGEIAGLGFQHTDVICIESWGHVVPARLAEDYDAVSATVEAMLARHDLKATALNAALPHPYLRDDASCAARRDQADALARLAVRLDAKVVSYYPGHKPHGSDPGTKVDEIIVTAGELAAVGREHGLTFVPEPHFATPLEDLDAVRRLLAASADLAVVYDPSHWAMQEIDLRETEFMLDRSAHVHLRDAAPGKMQTVFGAGAVDFDWLLDALAERAYAGHLAIEYLPNLEGGDVRDQLRRLRDKLLDRLAT